MEPATAALMVLLSCSPDGSHCREMRGAETCGSIAECRDMLPSVLKRLDEADETVMGRCALAADMPPPVDRMVTGSIPALGHGLATVHVTKFVGGRPVTEAYDVQKAP